MYLSALFACCIFQETPEPFPLPTEASIVKAAAGWAHCVSVTGTTNFLICFIVSKITLNPCIVAKKA